MKTCEGTFLEQRQYTKSQIERHCTFSHWLHHRKKTMCVPVISLISAGKASVDVGSVSRGHGGCLGSCASSGRGSRTRVVPIGSRNPKEHVYIVTGTIGYVIVVVGLIGHAVILLEEFWSLCTRVGRRTTRTEPSLGDLLLWLTLVDNDAKHRTGVDTRDTGTGEELEPDSSHQNVDSKSYTQNQLEDTVCS